jgi:leader peptidase (prepilin peptidase) / N-methyltransferase
MQPLLIIPPPPFDLVFWAVMGACVGSFLNVLIYRTPRGESVITPRSRCRCGATIAWYDNIPVFSWFVLRGRCRSCGERFSFRYPLVEAGTALVFAMLWWQYSPLVALAGMVFAGLMIPAALIDLDTLEIPDRFSIGGFIIGMLLSAVVPAIHGYSGEWWVIDALWSMRDAMLGACIGSGLILWLALVGEKLLGKEAMGFGDVKLMGAIGALCGWQGAIFALFGGAVLGTVAAAVWMLVTRRRPDVVPFGPALAAAALLYWLVVRVPVDAWFAELAYLFSFIGRP